MKHFGCLVVYSALTLLVLAKADEAKIVGYFSMETGSSCRYAVMDFKDDNKTGLHVKCSCPGGGGSGTKKIQYSCVYFGVPSSCDAYLDKSDGPETFFAEFADFIKNHGSHGCMHDELDAGRATKICKDQQLPFKRSVTIHGGDPRHCIKHPKTEL